MDKLLAYVLENKKKFFRQIKALKSFYFPIFEQYLDKYDLPVELKYLPVIESGLRARAVSSEGAKGLWQFMYPTAMQYGLKVNNYTDERYDIIKSTDAACKYLSDLHLMFGDWGLAISAYNSGPSAVIRAMKRAGNSKDFWEIRAYLPKETANYYPFFLSTLYVMELSKSTPLQKRFGKFQSVRHSGLQVKVPIVDTIVGRLSLKIQQLDVLIETKTLDDVFVKLKVSVQYVVIKHKVYEAFYKLEYPHEQITSYVFDVVRAEVPKLKLDDVFVKKDDIAIAVKRELQDAMIEYGYDIIKTLVTDIDPDAQVKAAMNRINASEREKIAAQFEGDAARIMIVEKARAEAESKRLQGQGIADQRREIAKGLEESVTVLNKVGINSQEASALIVVTQHYDTLQSLGGKTNSNLILLPNNPQSGSDMLSETIASFTASNQIGEVMRKQTIEKEKPKGDKKE
ncbi:protease [Elysia marginata]|uniref:Protease n=1 Tax=Elysia marginata TaxID=1093978 RepID=A0AAV4FQQ0_9GAST|nr:protease [Elysia marginata]